MALGDTNINTTNVGSEIGSSSNTVSGLVGASGLNKYSRYSPGTLGVDGAKNIILTPPTSNYMLGDFRRYNHSAIAPHWHSMGTQYWGPGGGSANGIHILIAMEQLNIAAIPDVGIDFTTNPAHYRARVDIYGTEPDRTAGTSLLHSIYPIEVNMVAHTPLSGHTRQVNWVLDTGDSGNDYVLNNIPVSSGDCTRYMEAYFCDIAGNRTANFGSNRAYGYVNVNFHENEAPQMLVGNYMSSGDHPPAHGGVSWTVVFPGIYNASAVCTTSTPIYMTQGSGDNYWYVKIKGLSGTQWHQIGVQNCDLHLLYGPNGNDYEDVIPNVSLTHNTGGYQWNPSLGEGRTWQYNWTGRVHLENITWYADADGKTYHCSGA